MGPRRPPELASETRDSTLHLQACRAPPNGASEGIVTGASSLPPLKKNDGKYGLIALLLLILAGGLWFFLRGDDSGPEAEPEPPPVEAPAREQFAADIEIPEEEDTEQETRQSRIRGCELIFEDSN